MAKILLRPNKLPIAAAVDRALREGNLRKDLEELLRIRDDNPIRDSVRGPVNGTVGWGEISKEQPPSLSTVSIEHGILDYQGFPPISGVTDSDLKARVVANQNRFPPYVAYDAGTALARSSLLNQYQNAAPPSSWTDLMRRHVQALYGSYHTQDDYTCATQGADSTITYKNTGGQGVDTTLGCWWGGTAGLMRIGLFNYVFVLFRLTTIEIFSTALTAESASHRSWLIAAMGGLSEDEIRFEEMGILAGLRPVPPTVIIYTRPGAPDAWEGAPLSYGWQFYDRYPGSAGNYDIGKLEARATCLGSGDAGPGIGSYTHTVTIDFDGTNYTIDDTTQTHATAASVAPGVALMALDIFGQSTRWGEAGTSPDGSSFPVMGRFNDDGTWFEEIYSSTSTNTDVEEWVNNRDGCNGTASGRAGRWNHRYSPEASLSSISGVKVASISTSSTTGASTPYGTAATSGTVITPIDGTWSSGSPGVDYCGSKPSDFQPVPCGSDDSPLVQYRRIEQENEDLIVRGGEYSGSYSGAVTLIPARGDPRVWYVVGVEYRTGVELWDTPLTRLKSNTYEGRSIERGSDPTHYCVGSNWVREHSSIGWSSNGNRTDHPASDVTNLKALRVAPDGTQTVAAESGTSNPVSPMPSGGSLIPVSPGNFYDPTQTYPGTLWDNLINPEFELFFNPPVAFESSGGVVCYTKEPNNPPIAPLHWPAPYAGTFEPPGENWVFIGDS